MPKINLKDHYITTHIDLCNIYPCNIKSCNIFIEYIYVYKFMQK